jgi:hypothetical protein
MTRILITVNNLNEFETKSTSILTFVSKWFAVNGLSQNSERTNALHFKSKHLQNDSFQFFFIKLKKLNKFYGLGLDRCIKWNNHMELIIPQMSSACYANRSIYSFSDKATRKMIYLASLLASV